MKSLRVNCSDSHHIFFGIMINVSGMDILLKFISCGNLVHKQQCLGSLSSEMLFDKMN